MKFMIAGTNTGCGKTTTSIALMTYFTSIGLNVCPFKVGPDYIDPKLHTLVTGNPSINLDRFLLDENTVKYLFERRNKNAELSIIEGVMGLFDGEGKTTFASSAHIAKIIKAPVILTVNAKGMSHSIVPLIKGYLEYDEDLKICGVILNKVSSKRHFELLKDMIEENLNIKVIGFLFENEGFSIESRKLGLKYDFNKTELDKKLEKLKVQISDCFDIKLLLEIASAENFTDYNPIEVNKVCNGIKIAVTCDECFNMYYEDNIELLERFGAEIVYFSPLNDSEIPNDISGIIFAGGSVERYISKIYDNVTMRDSIRNAVLNGMPVYAESGAITYFVNQYEIFDKSYDMLGLIDGNVTATDRLSHHFGYVNILAGFDSIILKKGMAIKAHEFHYYNENIGENVPKAFAVTKKYRSWDGGYSFNKLLLSSQHLHFYTDTFMAQNFVSECYKYNCEKLGG